MISGVILARNEERNIVACIEHLRPHVSEVILVDMESSDRTVELARPLVTQILRHPLIPNFDSARNIAINEAANDWMWFVDADERISVRLGQLINNLVCERGHEFEAITIPFKSYFCGQWMKHCGWWPGYTMPRVLKRGHFRFAEKLHGGVHSSGRQIRLGADPDLAIDHFSYESIEHYVAKLNRYTTTESWQLAQNGHSYDWQRSMRHMVHDLWQYYERNEGKSDGIRGWLLSWLSGQYRWLSYAKLIDQESDTGGTVDTSVPGDLDEVFNYMDHVLGEFRASSPKLPLGLIWRGPIWDPSGYADESRAFIKGLSQSTRQLSVQDIHWASQECDLDPRDRALFNALTRATRPRYSATITNCIPTVATIVPATSLNILRTTFESDRLPEGWLQHIEPYDEVWVISNYNYRTFVRSGVPPEKLRIVPSCIDLDLFKPEGTSIELPKPLNNRFVFLSVFDWAYRKGWDVLLKAYAESFSADEGVGLLLKITRNHGHSLEAIHSLIDEELVSINQSLAMRHDIVLWDEVLTAPQLSALYRSVDAFVLASRGEGWGRPYMEAMASGLPTIGTNASGNQDFMNDSNSFLVDAVDVDVSPAAVHEIPIYRGHRWFEPNQKQLGQTMRRVFDDQAEAKRRARVAVHDIQEKYALSSGRQAVERALAGAESRFRRGEIPEVQPDQVCVELEGELFAGHSFAKVNETLLNGLSNDPRIALSFHRVFHNPTQDDYGAQQALAYTERIFPDGPQVTIRHTFPPNWNKPAQGKWIHIQPFEFGHLPLDWIRPLCDEVDEIWVPSNYVLQVYVRSGIPKEKVHVIPWGIDTETYRPDAIPLLLPTNRAFRFLFVGGTIRRKGFDRVLQAYLEEFTPHDDVALVVKGLGEDTFYRYGNFREEVKKAKADPHMPEIIWLDRFLTNGQMPSLYTACDCLVAPYRGEGFGLPVLESMACGVPAIVPRGGATDDIVNDQVGFLLNSEERQTHHDWELAGPCLELEVSLPELRRVMRNTYQSRDTTREVGQRAASWTKVRFDWNQILSRMTERIYAIVDRSELSYQQTSVHAECVAPVTCNQRPLLTVGVVSKNSERVLAECLSRALPLKCPLVVLDRQSSDRSVDIAHEYNTMVLPVGRSVPKKQLTELLATRATSNWTLLMEAATFLDPDDIRNFSDALENVSPKRKSVKCVLGNSPCDRPAPSSKKRTFQFQRVGIPST